MVPERKPCPVTGLASGLLHRDRESRGSPSNDEEHSVPPFCVVVRRCQRLGVCAVMFSQEAPGAVGRGVGYKSVFLALGTGTRSWRSCSLDKRAS